MDGATGEDSTSRFETDPHVADQAMQHQETMYACSICFETATHPVASTCGHLFCWECLFAWLRGRPRPCPVCRRNLIQGVNIIPLFTFTGADVDECPAGEPQSNTINATMIPRRPPPPSPDRILGPIPLPAPVGVDINAVDDLTPSFLEEIFWSFNHPCKHDQQNMCPHVVRTEFVGSNFKCKYCTETHLVRVLGQEQLRSRWKSGVQFPP